MYFNWNTAKHQFEQTRIFDFLDSANVVSDQLVTDCFSEWGVTLFDFKSNKLESISLSYPGSASDLSLKYYTIRPLNDRYLFGSNTYYNSFPAFSIWCKKTSEVVYWQRPGFLSQIKVLEDGNISFSDKSSKWIERFGFFNQFDQPSQKTSVDKLDKIQIVFSS